MDGLPVYKLDRPKKENLYLSVDPEIKQFSSGTLTWTRKSKEKRSTRSETQKNVFMDIITSFPVSLLTQLQTSSSVEAGMEPLVYGIFPPVAHRRS